MAEICNELGIEKCRSLAYHSQGNGFSERNEVKQEQLYTGLSIISRLIICQTYLSETLIAISSV